ncbi:hypothetical protein ACFL3E_00235 [Patescibacteria group bacterium]
MATQHTEKMSNRPLSGLKDKLARLVSSIGAMKTVKRVQLASDEEIKKAGAFTEEQKQVIAENIGDIGKALASPERTRVEGSVIDEAENDMVEFVTSFPADAVRPELALFIISQMMEYYPQSVLGLQHITNIGCRLGVLSEAGDKVSDAQSVRLPVVNGDDRVNWKRMTSSFPGSKGLIPALQKRTAQLQQERNAERKDALGKLYEGNDGTLLEALEAGCGETVFFAPDAAGEKNGRSFFYPGGHMRVRVEDGKVHPIAAVGKCAKIVSQLVDEKVFVPARCVADERLELAKRVSKELFVRMVILHSLLHRGWKFALQNEAWNKARASATVKAHDFAINGEVGSALIYIKGWSVGDKPTDISFVAERNEGGAICVSGCPRQFEELFAECREFTAPGDKFSDLPHPLGAMLRKAYGGLSKAAARRENGGNGKDEVQPTADEHGRPQADSPEAKAIADELMAVVGSADSQTEPAANK